MLLIYDGFELLDYAGPISVFATAARIATEEAGELGPDSAGAAASYDILTLSAEGGLVASAGGATVVSQRIDAYQPATHDTVLVVGGAAAPLLAAAEEPRLLALLRAAMGTTERVGSVCSGTFVLAASGIIRGRRVATHWQACGELALRHPDLTIDAQALYVVDEALWTSAGVSTGIDMALEMVRRDQGESLMLATAQRLVVYAHRPGYQSQFSDLLKQQGRVPKGYRELLPWLDANLHRSLRVADMAAQVGQSERTFQRRFREAIGTPPARYLEDLRLQRARSLLAEGARVKQVAGAVGFRSEAAFRRAFEVRYGLTPAMASRYR